MINLVNGKKCDCAWVLQSALSDAPFNSRNNIILLSKVVVNVRPVLISLDSNQFLLFHFAFNCLKLLLHNNDLVLPNPYSCCSNLFNNHITCIVGTSTV